MARYWPVVLLLAAGLANAAVIEVRRTAIIRLDPDRHSAQILKIKATRGDPVDVALVGLERNNGFYRVFVPDSDAIGWIPKGSGRLKSTAAHDTLQHFERETFTHWTDEDEDCQNARTEVLVRDAEGPVVFRTTRECTVASGTWRDPFTGNELSDPSDLDIDHLVPLENAFLSGAWNWTKERRESYANFLGDPLHLLAVDDSENQRKGARGPEDYLPPNTAFHCDYVDAWIRIKRDWGLKMSVREAEATFRTHFGCVGLPP